MRDVPFRNLKSYFKHKSINENCVMESSVKMSPQMKMFPCICLRINLNNVILSLSLFGT